MEPHTITNDNTVNNGKVIPPRYKRLCAEEACQCWIPAVDIRKSRSIRDMKAYVRLFDRKRRGFKIEDWHDHSTVPPYA